MRNVLLSATLLAAALVAVAPTAAAASPTTGRVTGRVVDAAGAPLHGVAIRVNNTDTPAVTNAAGRYAVATAPAGSDVVCAVGAGNHGGGSPTGYLDACVDVTVAAGHVVTAPDIVLAQPGGAITGTVRDGEGAVLAGAGVWTDDDQGGPTFHATTRSNGTYAFLGLPDGTYTVCFDGSTATGGGATAGYGNQCWQYIDEPDGYDVSSAAPVVVHAGTTITGVSARLPRWGAVTGTVTDPSGAVAVGVPVAVFRTGQWSSPTIAVTGPDGRYRVASLPPGAYAVCVRPGEPASGVGFLDHCVGSDSGVPWSAPTAATVTSDATAAVDDVLVPAGQLSGVVLDSASRPVVGAVVSVSHHDGNYLGAVTSDASGQWTFDFGGSGDNGATSGRRLVPGAYDVSVSGPSGGDYVGVSHPSGYQVGGSSYGTVRPVSVVGGVVTSISDTLFHGGTVGGTVRAPDGDVLGNAFVTTARGHADPSEPGTGPYADTAADGTWSVAGMPPGTYHLCVTSYQTTAASPAGFLARCPTGVAADGLSTTVTLREGRSVNSVITMSPAAGVAGQVTDSAGHPLASSQVTVSNAGGVVATASTSSTGTFEVDRLQPGSYTVCAQGGQDRTASGSTEQAWAVRCWGAPVGAPGAAIAASAGAVRSGTDIVLPAGAPVSGRVTDAAGDDLDGAAVVLAAGKRRFTVTTDEWGRWSTTVTPGTYTVCATAPGHADGCFVQGSGTTPARVPVAVSQPVRDLDIVLN